MYQWFLLFEVSLFFFKIENFKSLISDGQNFNDFVVYIAPSFSSYPPIIASFLYALSSDNEEAVSETNILFNSRRSGGPEICPPDYQESDDRIYWLYFGLRFVGTTMMSASVTVMDPVALTLIQQYGGEFGRERLFSTVGMAIFSPLTGILIDYKSSQQGLFHRALAP